MKKTISFIICFIIAFGGIVIGIGSLSAGAYSSWQEAYRSYLLELAEEYSPDSGNRFELVFIDTDNIPELVVTDGPGAHGYGYTVLVYKNGIIIESNSLGSNTFWYYPKKGIYGHSGSGGAFSGGKAFYRLEGTQSILIDECLYEYSEEYPEIPKYTINDVEVSESDYRLIDEKYAQNYGQEKEFSGTPLTEANINKALKNDETTTKAPVSSSSASELSDAQREKFAEFMADYLTILGLDGYNNGVPELRKITCSNVGIELIRNNHFEIFYPEKLPQNAITTIYDNNNGYYSKVRADVFDTVLKDVFNFSDNEVKAFKESKSFINEKDHYADNYYYFYNNCDYGGWGSDYTISIINVEKKDGYYFIKYNAKEEYSAEKETYYCLLKWKSLNSTKFWSLYKNSDTEFRYENIIKDLEKRENDILDSSSIASEETDISNGIETQDESVNPGNGSSGEDATPENEEKTENDDSANQSNSKLGQKKAAIIIAAASAFAVIASAIAVILIKKHKVGMSISNANESFLDETQTQELTPVYSSDSSAETTQPDPTGKLIKYNCREAGRGGLCEMCKNQTNALYIIEARKGERIQSHQVCRNCGARIIAKFKKQNEMPDNH